MKTPTWMKHFTSIPSLLSEDALVPPGSMPAKRGFYVWWENKGPIEQTLGVLVPLLGLSYAMLPSSNRVAAPVLRFFLGSKMGGSKALTMGLVWGSLWLGELYLLVQDMKREQTLSQLKEVWRTVTSLATLDVRGLSMELTTAFVREQLLTNKRRSIPSLFLPLAARCPPLRQLFRPIEVIGSTLNTCGPYLYMGRVPMALEAFDRLLAKAVVKEKAK